MARLEHSGRPQLVHDIQQEDDDSNQTETKNLHVRHSPSSFSSLGEKKGGAGVSEVRTYDDDSAIDSDAIWRPQWLRPAVLGVFTGLFACLAIAFFVMFSYSQQHDGLFETRESLVYLWRFAPTAVLTIISVLWNRTEVQAMRYMPWIESRHEKSNDWSDLDYLSLLTPQTIVQSLRKKHYLVFLTALASLLIQAQIVLAPGLFRLIPVSVETPTAIQKLDTFNRTYRVANDDGDSFTYHAARALNDFDVSYPFGLTKDVAYQTFMSSTGNLRGTINAPLNAVVDGFFTDIECLKLQNHSLVSMGPAEGGKSGYKMEVALQFDGCQYSVELPYVTATKYAPFYFEHWKVDSELRPAETCPSLPQEHLPFVHYAVRTIPSPLNSSLPVIANASAVLCSSRAWFSEVDITDDGVSPKITALSNRSSTPFDTDVWALLSNTIPPGIMSWGNSMYGGTYQGPVNAEQSFNNTFISTERVTNDLLYDSVTGMFRRLAPLTGHYILRQGADVGADGQTLHVIQVIRSPENSYNINKYQCDLPDDPADEMSVADMRKAGIRYLSNTLMRTYWWGAFNHEKNAFDFNTYWRCNYSWGGVMVDVKMVAGEDGDMMIDPTNPPRTDDSTMKPFDPPFVVPYLEETGESTLGDLLMGYDRDAFNTSTGSKNPPSWNIAGDFLGLFKRQGPLLPESLGSPDDQTKVLAALTEKFGFAMAQLASMENRLGVDEDSTTAPFPPEGLPSVNAVVSDIGRRRLVQDPAITYAIVAILCLVVLVQLWFLVSKALRLLGVGDGWLSMDVKGLAPPDYASISMTASLLHDSNVTNHLPRDTQGLLPSELHGLLAGLRFRLGWFQRASDGTRHFTIGILDDKEFDFVSSKKDM
ncbi:hypothetical protein CkaCkLH20_04586 [Colletotrichum karsti]|uniref:Uncharacterized protein n=1 Tax=Colletotrichum karsti TaxID=1095194 RepID=A0A9P6LM59_9PEZI|nr:uncharacterized protein CkaCkLH20_04586 [Colletotrichum karsti]KAF9878010.1 hypothetical protein CkaCkLH20_04586 [Colletotrichum karsti]